MRKMILSISKNIFSEAVLRLLFFYILNMKNHTKKGKIIWII